VRLAELLHGRRLPVTVAYALPDRQGLLHAAYRSRNPSEAQIGLAQVGQRLRLEVAVA
jgi:hypothetical protein